MGQIVKFVELVHDCILSKQQRNEMNRRYMRSVDQAFCKSLYLLTLHFSLQIL